MCLSAGCGPLVFPQALPQPERRSQQQNTENEGEKKETSEIWATSGGDGGEGASADMDGEHLVRVPT